MEKFKELSDDEAMREIAERGNWIDAKTYKYTWPHEYMLKKDMPEEVWNRFLSMYQKRAYQGCFYSKEIWYMTTGGYTYWAMVHPNVCLKESTLINRCVVEESFMYLKSKNLISQRLKERKNQEANIDQGNLF